MPKVKRTLTTLTPQATIAATGVAQRLYATPNTLAIQDGLVEAVSSNAADIYIGGDAANAVAGTGHRLSPGQALDMVLDDDEDNFKVFFDPYDIWISGTIGDKVTFSYFAETSSDLNSAG